MSSNRLLLLCFLLASPIALQILGCSPTERERPPKIHGPNAPHIKLSISNGRSADICTLRNNRMLITSSGITHTWDLEKAAWSGNVIPRDINAISPDEKTMAQVYYRRGKKQTDPETPEIYLLDAKSGLQLHVLKGHKFYVKSLSFSPDSSMLASGSRDGTVRIWDVKSGRSIHTISIPDRYFEALAFSPDGKTLAATGCYGFSGGDEYDYLTLWDTKTWQMTRRIPIYQFGMDAVEFSRNGKWIASSEWANNDDRMIDIWNLASGEKSKVLYCRNMVTCLRTSPDGSMLTASEFSGYVESWDTRTWKLKWSARISKEHIDALAYSSDGRTVVAGTAREFVHQSRMGEVILLGAVDGSLKKRFTVPDLRPAVLSLSMSPDDSQVCGRYSDGIERKWDMKSGKLRGMDSSFKSNESHNGSHLTWEPSINLPVNCAVYSPDHKTVVTGGSGEVVRFWDAQRKTQSEQVKGNVLGVTAVLFSPDGRKLITGGGDGTIMIWNVKTHKLLATFVVLPPQSTTKTAGEWITFTPESYYIASRDAQKFIEWSYGDFGYPGDAYRRHFNRPHLVKNALRGDEDTESKHL